MRKMPLISQRRNWRKSIQSGNNGYKCIENYTGARCEEVLLPSLKTQIKSERFAAFLASVVVLGILVIGAFYFLCRKAHIRRASSTERGASLVETTSSNGCNKITE
uniref:Uncharacterized protein n=1 Tax=Gopherus agassizii TaxID=38772 RepID=A0A452HJ82_9SAUR